METIFNETDRCDLDGYILLEDGPKSCTLAILKPNSYALSTGS